MRVSTFTTLAGLSALANALPASNDAGIEPFTCHQPDPSPELYAQMKQWYDEDKQSKASGNHSQFDERAAPKLIDLYFHVVQSSAQAGKITQKQLSNQHAMLNGAYALSGFQFRLLGSDFTTNDDWAADLTNLDMATQLRKGTYGTLNIYFHTDLGAGNLGSCALPSPNPGGPTSQYYINDGCNIAAETVPGGSIYGYNQGKTAVHETGHWLGLLHPFQGNSCTGDGDMIDDTPAESVATSGCPNTKDSCPSQAGQDPIHNYMDYSSDACYTGFTADQNARMSQMWTSYRQGK